MLVVDFLQLLYTVLVALTQFRHLSPDRVMVTVKVHNNQYRELLKVLAGCKALKKLRDRNLVKVINACSSINFEGKDFKATVY